MAHDGLALRADADMTPLFDLDATTMETLRLIGPEAEMAPYGLEAQVEDDGTPVYTSLFYALAPDADMSKVPPGTRTRTMPAGTYAVIDYNGTWSQVGCAYGTLREFIDERGLRADGPFRETSHIRLLDTDISKSNSSVSVAVK